MKRCLAIACTFVSTIGMTSLAVYPAMAQSEEPPSAPAPAGSTAHVGASKVAVIVFQQAVAQTNEGQRNFAALREKFAPKQEQLKQQSQEIDTLKKQLQSAGSTLSDLDRSSRLRTIDDKTKALQREAEDDQNDFNSQMQDIYQALAQKVYKVVDSYAKAHGFTLVLDASNQQTSPVLWVNPANDITKEVVEAYNAQSGVSAPTSQGAAPRTTTPRMAPHTTPRRSTK